MMWNNKPHHHTIVFFHVCMCVCFFLDEGVTDCILIMAYCDKLTCHEKKLIIFFSNFFNKKVLKPFRHDVQYQYIHHDVYVYNLHLYQIH